MHWHIDTDVVSLIVITALYVYSLRIPSQEGNELRDKRFLRCLLVSIIVTVIDIAASVIMEVPTSRFLYHLLMTAYFVTVELVIVEWFLYVASILYQEDARGERTVSRIVIGVYALYALFNLSNPWTGAVYTLGLNVEYARGPFFWLMVALYAAYALALFVLTVVRWKKIPKGYPAGVLLMTPVVLAVSIAVQLSFSGLLLILPSYMICLVLAFLFLQTMRLKNNRELVEHLSRAAETDQLTGLFNRTGMEAMVQQTLACAYGQDVLVLIVDIDDLKSVNDTMGHQEGDRTIQSVATQLKRHFRTSDTVVRYGGDEFLVFLTGDLNEAQVHRSLSSLVSELGALRIGERNDVPIHASVGAAHGAVGLDSFESLCNKADTALYHVKRSGKNGYAIYKPEMETEKLGRDAFPQAPVSVS